MVSDAFKEEYRTARQAAGVVGRADRGWIVVSGGDRASFLHGLLTNDVASLRGGDGRYAAYLTPQGRMIADMWVYELGDVILLSVPQDVKDTLLAKLDQLIFSEDVQLGDVTDTFAAVTVIGPQSSSAVASALGMPDAVLTGLAEHGNLRASFNEQPAIVLRVTDWGEPGYDVLVEAAQIESLRAALHAAGVADLAEAVVQACRIEAGIPKFRQDMDEDTIPLEAGIEARAISLSKGCYVGQEVIIRVLHRGHGRVARRLVGLVFPQGPVPSPGAVVQADGREIGRITSATWSPAKDCPVALGYVQRDFVAPGKAVLVNGQPAEVAALPFVGAATTRGEAGP